MIYQIELISNYMIGPSVNLKDDEGWKAYKALVALYIEICKGEISCENPEKIVFKDGTVISITTIYPFSDIAHDDFITPDLETDIEYHLDTGGTDELPDEMFVTNGFRYPIRMLFRHKEGWCLVNKADMFALLVRRMMTLQYQLKEMGASFEASAKALYELSREMKEPK
jgi:hypothetical protein